MKREEFLKLLSRKLSGELSDAEVTLFNKATDSSEEYRVLTNEFHNYLNHKLRAKPYNEELSRTWKMISTAENEGFIENFNYSSPKKTILSNSLVVKIAAILILLVGSYYVLTYKSHLNVITQTANNQKSFKMLDDGTKIWLNKKSSISYNKAFGQHKRELFLEGEAYFDVAKNKAVPFIIHTRSIDIEVKGTAFNVNAYKENDKIQVALLRGLIQVTDKLNSKHKVLLKPDQKLIVSRSQLTEVENNFVVLSLNSKTLLNDVRWIADTLVFRKEKLKDLAVRMEKKYDLKINIQSEPLKEKRFSGTFTDETIQQALEALKLSYPLTYSINNRLVVIKD